MKAMILLLLIDVCQQSDYPEAEDSADNVMKFYHANEHWGHGMMAETGLLHRSRGKGSTGFGSTRLMPSMMLSKSRFECNKLIDEMI